MSASVGDKITDIRNSARPVTATVNGTRSSGGTTLLCDSLVGWPTASKVHFVTFQIDSTSNPVAGTQLDCSGIVSGSAINSFTVIDGNDTGNAVGDKVEMLPTAAWGQDLADALTSTHNRSGGLKSGLTITTPTIVTPTLTNPTSTNPTLNSPTFGGTPATGTLSAVALTYPYKFSVVQTSGQTINGGPSLVTFGSKLFDTGNNFSTSTSLFTAPIAGFYLFTFSCHTSPTGGDTSALANIYKNGTLSQQIDYAAIGTNQHRGLSGSLPVQLSANDTVGIAISSTSGAVATVASGTDIPVFSGLFISPS